MMSELRMFSPRNASPIISALLLLAVTACTQDEKLNYREALNLVDREVPMYVLHPHVLRDSETFGQLWRNPFAYREDSLKVLASPHSSTAIRDLAVMTMNNLPVADYAKFCDEVLTIAENRAATTEEQSASTVMTCLFPVLNKDILHSYQRAEVRSLYTRAQASKLLNSEQKQMVASVLDGRLAPSFAQRLLSWIKQVL